MKNKLSFPVITSSFFFAVTSASGSVNLNPITGENSSHDSDEIKSQELIKFDSVFISEELQNSVNLSRFESGASVLPGVYLTDIYLNGELIAREDIRFFDNGDGHAVPCIDKGLIKLINFDHGKLDSSFTNGMNEENRCHNLESLIPQSKVTYDSGMQRLDISIPQAMINNTPRGYVSPELWDSGIPALLVGYNANTYTTSSKGVQYNSAYAGINAGINLGAWYIRHDGYYNWEEKSGGEYQSLNNYVQRDIPAILGRVRVGDTSTKDRLFDTLPFRGIELVSDDRMLPQSQRGYAPDIRGIARTNARVVVRQNGKIIYETSVSPGAFFINDLYATGYAGNLDVTINEADGTTQKFKVPYSSVSQLLRPGTHRYGFVAGKLNDLTIKSKPTLFQASYLRGINNNITGYGGVQASQDYYALQIGAAMGTSIGAFSADVTQSRVHLKTTDKRVNQGQSYGLSYSKYLPKSDSNLTIAAYRYSTEGYYDYLTAMRAIDAENSGQSSSNIWRPRNRFNVTINQGLYSGFGQVYLTGYSQDYWNSNNSDLQYQLGYSNNYRNINYSLSAGRARSMHGSMETTWLFNLTMPLGGVVDNYIPTMNAGLTKSSEGRVGEQIGISGSAGENYEYNYGISAMRYNQGTGNSLALNGGYRSPYTNMTSNFGAGKNYNNASVGVSGAVIAWKDGVVMTPYNADTFAIVEAKGASGAKVSGYSGIQIDPWGHAAVPYLNPYEMNEISINPKGIPDDIELGNTSSKVAPYFGSITKVVFKTQKGFPLIITAKKENGDLLPFGAEVFDINDNSVGAVGQMGVLYARVAQPMGVLIARWGRRSEEKCFIRYNIPDKDSKSGASSKLIKINSVCGAE